MTRGTKVPGTPRKPGSRARRMTVRGLSNARWSAFEHARVGVGLAAPDGRWVEANPALCELLGTSRTALLKSNTTDVLHPEERSAHELRRRDYTAGRLEPLDLLIRLVRADGETVHTRVNVAPVLNARGRLLHSVIQVQDITAQVRAEEALRRHATDFRGLLDVLPEPVGVYRNERFCYVNQEMVELLGCHRPDEVLGRSVWEFTHPEERVGIADQVTQATATGEASSPSLRTVIRQDRRVVTVESLAVVAMFDGMSSVVWIARDVTERQEYQARLLLADRMASVGTLAAGAAHEINNPLAYMIANLDYVLGEIPRLPSAGEAMSAGWRDEVTQALREVREGAERVRMVVKDLKSFSRVDEEQRGPVDVRKVLDTTVNIAANEIRHRARLERAYGPVPLVEANEARLGQVFLNLVLNAAQAIAEGHQADNTVKLVTRTEDGRAVVEVHDTGEGIPESVMARIFDPFFTTKPVGVGTGLGLSICHGIVTALGGEITVESTLGRGTVFRVDLPAAATARKPVRSMPAPMAPPRRGRVLVIDDEPVLGRSVRRMLSSEHDVTAMTSARDALAAIAAGSRWDVILCDLMMPDMTGMDLYAALGSVAPDQVARMVFLTGGAFTQRARAFLDALPNACLDKPFDSKALRGLIRDMLQSHPLPP